MRSRLPETLADNGLAVILGVTCRVTTDFSLGLGLLIPPPPLSCKPVSTPCFHIMKPPATIVSRNTAEPTATAAMAPADRDDEEDEATASERRERGEGEIEEEEEGRER